jgi:hypothetical protein
MGLRTLTFPLTAASKRLYDPVASGEAGNIPYRQLLFTATGADAQIGDSTVTATSGTKVSATATSPVSLGPFNSGPIKLSDVYALGAGATLSVVGVPF